MADNCDIIHIYFISESAIIWQQKDKEIKYETEY